MAAYAPIEVSAEIPAQVAHVMRTVWRDRIATRDTRSVPEETAIAISYNGTAQAVMMATPADLEDFAIGFSLTERLIGDLSDIGSIEIVPFDIGIEARLWIGEEWQARLAARRRSMAGPTGCGLCGVESLAEALPVPPALASAARFTPDQLMRAVVALADAQVLRRETHAVHGAGFWSPSAGLVLMREDLGRHNALDKLVGAMARHGATASEGIAVITSRVSVEMVQKAARLGAPVLVAVSAPTALAIRTAEQAGLTLVAIARSDGFEIFTRPERIELSGR